MYARPGDPVHGEGGGLFAGEYEVCEQGAERHSVPMVPQPQAEDFSVDTLPSSLEIFSRFSGEGGNHLRESFARLSLASAVGGREVLAEPSARSLGYENECGREKPNQSFTRFCHGICRFSP
jgi:hypothetical protein